MRLLTTIAYVAVLLIGMGEMPYSVTTVMILVFLLWAELIHVMKG